MEMSDCVRPEVLEFVPVTLPDCTLVLPVVERELPLRPGTVIGVEVLPLADVEPLIEPEPLRLPDAV